MCAANEWAQSSMAMVNHEDGCISAHATQEKVSKETSMSRHLDNFYFKDDDKKLLKVNRREPERPDIKRRRTKKSRSASPQQHKSQEKSSKKSVEVDSSSGAEPGHVRCIPSSFAG